MKDTVFYSKKTLNVRGKLIDFSKPLIMGILNVTPDSFYKESRVTDMNAIVERAGKMLEEGASILDLGGYSSRPGADHISEKDEADRIIPALEKILAHFPEAIVSIDTFRASIAAQSLQLGASMINDISGGTMDEGMYGVIAKYQAPYILMHMRGTPQTMTKENHYDDLINEIIGYFAEKVTFLQDRGIKDIVIDPGFGFAKNIDQNYLLLKNLKMLKILGLPILAGISRKSMIYKRLNKTADEALAGSIVLQTLAVLEGASILRVHDVKEMSDAIQLLGYMDYF